MEGYVTKRGKRSGSRVRRYMCLTNTQLSNHHVKDAPPTWAIDISEAIITCNSRRKRITIEIHNERLDIYLDSPKECDSWYEALNDAKSMHKLKVSMAFQRPARIPISPQERSEEQLKQYTKGFKVVQNGAFESINKSGFTEIGNVLSPPSAASDVKGSESRKEEERKCSTSTDDDEDDLEDEELEIDGDAESKGYPQGQISYEETPASMIFKQFNFPTASNAADKS